MGEGHRRATTRPGGRSALGGSPEPVVTAEDVDWLIARLRAVVAASPTVWAGRGMTLPQLTALHLISAHAPVTLGFLAEALGTGAPATSAMVDRLTDAGLVRSTPDPRNRRRVQLTITPAAEPIVGDTDPETARRLRTVLDGIGTHTRRHLIDVLRDSVRQTAGQP